MSVTKTEYQTAYDSGFDQTVRVLLMRGLAKAEAEDVAQAAWVRGWEKLETLRAPAKVRSWVHSIALNLLRGDIRRDRRLTALLEHDAPANQPPLALRIDLSRSLRSCPAEERALLEDLYVYGYSSEEVGRRWGLKPTTVRVRVFRAKQRLRELLSPSIRPRPEAPVGSPVVPTA